MHGPFIEIKPKQDIFAYMQLGVHFCIQLFIILFCAAFNCLIDTVNKMKRILPEK